MISKMAIVFGVFFGLVWIGIVAGRFAETQAKQTQAEYSTAFSILENN